MRHVLLGVGVFLTLVGLVWVGQGAGLLPGSAMTGQREWVLIGLLAAVAGTLLIVRSVRASTRPPR